MSRTTDGRDGRGGRVPIGFTLAVLAVPSVLSVPSPLPAQDYTPPRAMGLPVPGFRPPNPAAVQFRLANGMVSYVVEDRTVPLVTLTAFVRAGVVDAARPGAALAVERALQSGPGPMPASEFSRTLTAMTADFQVSVGPDLTRISLNVPAEDAWRALELLAGVLREPRLTVPDPAVLRRGVALPAERAVGESGPVLYEGSMPVAVNLFEGLLYGDHPYGGRISAAAAAAVTYDDAAEFHRRYFVPANVVVALAGALDPADARRRVEQLFGNWPSARPARRAALPPLQGPAARGVHLVDADKLQGWIVIGHELPQVPVADEAPLEVMNYVLAGDHLAGRMFLEARDRRGLANDEIGHVELRLRGPGTYTVRAAGRAESITQLIDVAFREVERIRAEPVTDEELFVAKGALADGEFAYRYRNGHASAAAMAEEWASYGDHRRSATYADRVRAVTAADVLAAARKYLHPERMQVVVLGPLTAIREAAARGGHPALEQFGAVSVPR